MDNFVDPNRSKIHTGTQKIIRFGHVLTAKDKKPSIKKKKKKKKKKSTVPYMLLCLVQALRLNP